VGGVCSKCSLFRSTLGLLSPGGPIEFVGFCVVSIGSPEWFELGPDEGRIGMVLAKGGLNADEVPRNGLLLSGGPTEAIEGFCMCML